MNVSFFVLTRIVFLLLWNYYELLKVAQMCQQRISEAWDEPIGKGRPLTLAFWQENLGLAMC